MIKFYRSGFCFLIMILLASKVQAQSSALKPVKVAVFAPLYLDDAFADGIYSLDKNSIPKNILPGLEFYNGVMMAIDSIQKEGANVQINIYDSRQSSLNIETLFNSLEFNNVGLVIASIINPTELKLFATQSLKKNIPIISATYPNYVGINSNPFFVLLNSSLQAHIEGLYKHMQRSYNLKPIVVIRKKGVVEDYIKNIITDLNKNSYSVPLKLKWVDMPETFSSADIVPYLDSTTNNVVLVASPSESFGLQVVRSISERKEYPVTAIGMPTWDGIKELSGSSCKNVEIVYSTPFNYSKTYGLGAQLATFYKTKFYSTPSDMVYKGFEATYHFTKLLIKHHENLVNNLSDKEFTLFTQFDIQPVKLKKQNLQPDYLENKHLYFIKKQAGYIKSIL